MSERRKTSNSRRSNTATASQRRNRNAAPEQVQSNGGTDLVRPNQVTPTPFSSYEDYRAAREELVNMGMRPATVGWPYGPGAFSAIVTANDDGNLFTIITLDDGERFIETVNVSDVVQTTEAGEEIEHSGSSSASFPEALELQDGDEVLIAARPSRNGRVYANVMGMVE